MCSSDLISWLSIQNRLATRDRVSKYISNIDMRCVFCLSQSETAEHLFFTCKWGREALKMIKNWLSWQCQKDDLVGLTKWIRRSKMSKFRKKMFMASIAALVYCIWKSRNLYIWKDERIDLDKVVSQVKCCVKNRVELVKVKEENCIDTDWFNML